jgi:hypothetical protein
MLPIVLNQTGRPITPVEEYPFDPSVRTALVLADFDGDGEMEIYSLRCERTRSGEGYTSSACMRPWTVWLVVTKANAKEPLLWASWCESSRIEAWGWAADNGDFAVKVGGNWQRIAKTAPRGAYETPGGEIKRQ